VPDRAAEPIVNCRNLHGVRRTHLSGVLGDQEGTTLRGTR